MGEFLQKGEVSFKKFESKQYGFKYIIILVWLLYKYFGYLNIKFL